MKTAKLKTLAPRMPTPSPSTGGTLTTGRLPDDFLAEQVRRLALLSIIGVGLWMIIGGVVVEPPAGLMEAINRSNARIARLFRRPVAA